MEVRVYGFENFTIEHVQMAYNTLAKLQSEKYGIEIKYTVRKKTEADK